MTESRVTEVRHIMALDFHPFFLCFIGFEEKFFFYLENLVLWAMSEIIGYANEWCYWINLALIWLSYFFLIAGFTQ